MQQESADRDSYFTTAEWNSPPQQPVSYLRGGEERRGELQQALDLDLHGGQGALADCQRLPET